MFSRWQPCLVTCLGKLFSGQDGDIYLYIYIYIYSGICIHARTGGKHVQKEKPQTDRSCMQRRTVMCFPDNIDNTKVLFQCPNKGAFGLLLPFSCRLTFSYWAIHLSTLCFVSSKCMLEINQVFKAACTFSLLVSLPFVCLFVFFSLHSTAGLCSVLVFVLHLSIAYSCYNLTAFEVVFIFNALRLRVSPLIFLQRTIFNYFSSEKVGGKHTS